MKRAIVVLLTLAACGTPDTKPATATPSAARPEVTLVFDQLEAVTKDPTVRDRNASYEARLAIARKELGSDGEPVKDATFEGTAFVALGPGEYPSAYTCRELVIAKAAPYFAIRVTTVARCGLGEQRGHGPATTVLTLRALATEVADQDPLAAEMTVRKRLGGTGQADVPQWTGIGPRGQLEDAPFSCWVLSLGPPKVWEAPLSRCDLSRRSR